LRAKIGDDAKDGAGHIANMAKPADKVSDDFGRNPGVGIGIFKDNSGAGTSFGPWLCRSPCQYSYMGYGSLRALSQNRDSTSRISLC
jgi:hypothetical protein